MHRVRSVWRVALFAVLLSKFHFYITVCLVWLWRMIHLRIRPFDHRHRSHKSTLTVFAKLKHANCTRIRFFEWHSIITLSLALFLSVFLIVVTSLTSTLWTFTMTFCQAYLLTICYCANHLLYTVQKWLACETKQEREICTIVLIIPIQTFCRVHAVAQIFFSNTKTKNYTEMVRNCTLNWVVFNVSIKTATFALIAN